MKSLNQYITEVSSDLLKRAHNAQVKRKCLHSSLY